MSIIDQCKHTLNYYTVVATVTDSIYLVDRKVDSRRFVCKVYDGTWTNRVLDALDKTALAPGAARLVQKINEYVGDRLYVCFILEAIPDLNIVTQIVDAATPQHILMQYLRRIAITLWYLQLRDVYDMPLSVDDVFVDVFGHVAVTGNAEATFGYDSSNLCKRFSLFVDEMWTRCGLDRTARVEYLIRTSARARDMRTIEELISSADN